MPVHLRVQFGFGHADSSWHFQVHEGSSHSLWHFPLTLPHSVLQTGGTHTVWQLPVGSPLRRPGGQTTEHCGGPQRVSQESASFRSQYVSHLGGMQYG